MRDSSRRPRSLLLLFLVLGALLAAVSACGGEEEAAPPPAADTAAQPPAEPAPPPPEPAEPPPPPEPPAPAPATLNVALDWFPNPDHVALYYALGNGYYDEQALTVNFKTPSDVTAGLKLVATKKFDLAIFYEGDMFFAAQEDVPVIAVGSLVPTPLNALISIAGSKVTGPDTIEGATIGVAGLPFDDAILTTMTAQQGLPKDAVKSVNVGFDLVPALLTKKVDAVIGAYFNIEGTVLEHETGEEPHVTKLEELGVPHYDELIVVANRDRLAAEPEYADAVRRFLAAMVKGTESAQADVAGSTELMKEHTEYKPAELEGMVPDTLELLTSPKGLPPGCFDVEDWRAFGQWMLENKLIEAEVDPATIVTNDYLPGC